MPEPRSLAGFEDAVRALLAWSEASHVPVRSRVLLLLHERSGIPIDLSLGALPFEENAVRRAVPTDVGGLRVPLPVPEDLLVMKAVAHRARDIADIESLLSAHPRIDEAWIVATVRAFAEVLDAPELVIDLEALLQRRAPAKDEKTKRRRGGGSRPR